MMRKLAFAALSAVAILSAPVVAAEGQYNWTGLYLGGTVGVGNGSSTHCDGADCNSSGTMPLPNVSLNNAVAGITVGYNFQFNQVVAGIEADYSLSGMKGSTSSTSAFGCGGTFGCSSEIDQFGTVRGRLGYAFGRFLPYITAGIADTHLKAAIGNPVLGSASAWKTSAVYGLGAEAAFVDKWSLKIEYLRVTDPGKLIEYAGCGFPGCGIKNNAYNIMRMGLSYKF